MKKIELISLAIEPELKEAIQEEAEKQDRSVSSLIRLLIKKALEDGQEGSKKWKLNNSTIKNQFIIESTEKIVFQSYDSTIAVVEGQKLTLGKDWNYSATTLKHLYKFMDEYACSYSIMVMSSSNKRREIQRLIDDGIIGYDATL